MYSQLQSVEGCFYRKLFTLKLAVLHRTLKITSLIYYLCKHSQRPQKLTYSYTQIFWVSCDQPMPGPFPFPNLRKGLVVGLRLGNPSRMDNC